MNVSLGPFWMGILVDIGLVVGLVVFYYVLEPYAHRSKFMRGWLNGIIVMVLAWLMLLLVSAKSLWDFIGHGEYWQALLLSRSTVNGAHIATYLTIPFCVFVVAYYQRPKKVSFKPTKYEALNGWLRTSAKMISMPFCFALIVAGFMVFAHEGIWYIFYDLTYFRNLDLNIVFTQDIFFFLLVSTLGFIFIRKYHGWNKRVEWALAAYVLYLVAWFAIGFPVTVATDQFGMAQYGMTPLHDSLFVNAVEVGSWWLIFIAFVWAYHGHEVDATLAAS